MDAKKYEEASIGQSLKRLLKYWKMAEKFNGFHPELQDIGVTEVRVTDQGLEKSNQRRSRGQIVISCIKI